MSSRELSASTVSVQDFAYGMCGVDGSVASLFVLLHQPGTIGARQVYLFETLYPRLFPPRVAWPAARAYRRAGGALRFPG